MKTTRLLSTACLLGCWTAAAALAQDIAPRNAAQVTGARPAAYDAYYDAPDGNGAGTATVEKPAVSASPDTACQDGCNSCGDCKENPCRLCIKGKLADPWTLPQPRCLKDRNITIGGWLEGGIYGNQYGAPSNGPVGLRNVGDGFTADQLWIFAERKTDTKGCGWDVGGRVDYLFGADGPQTQASATARGTTAGTRRRNYGSAIPQLYAEIAYNDVKVKVGHFYTPIGYEVVQATGQLLLLAFLFAHLRRAVHPHRRAGRLSAQREGDVYGGWVNGWDEGFEGKDNGSMFLGGLSLNLSEKATLGLVRARPASSATARPSPAPPRATSTTTASSSPTSSPRSGPTSSSTTWARNYNVNQRTGVDNQWYEVNNYLIYKINDCLSFGGRVEWFQDPQGARVVGRQPRQLLRRDRRLQLQAARQHHDPAGTPLRLVRRLCRKRRAAVQQRHRQHATLRRLRHDLHVLVLQR